MNATARQVQPPAARRSIAWKATLILIPVLTAIMLLWLRQAQVRHLASRNIAPKGKVPAFQLTNQDGKPFGSAQLTGKIWIADFIFTTCPGPCPIISSRMSDLQRPLEKTDVQLVSFSVDPETDTPEVLRRYAEKLKAEPTRWNFLTGEKSAIYDLSQHGFKLAVAESGDAPDQPVHSSRFVLVDRQGLIRGYYDALASDAVTKLLADTTHLLREQPK